MIRPLEPSPLDEEPLLRPLVLDADKGEAASPGGLGSPRVRLRPGAAAHHYTTRARSVVLQVHDQIIRVSDEEEEPADDEEDDGDDGDDGRRLKASSFVFGACGLRSFGHSTFWRFVGGLFKLVYAYYFFIWSIIYGGLALCFLISIVYEGWSTGDPLGTAAIIVSMLPVLNLLFIFFSFTLHALFLGVLWDFYDLESALFAIRVRLQSLSARTALTALVTFLVNAPVFFSLIVFCVATAQPVSDRSVCGHAFLDQPTNRIHVLINHVRTPPTHDAGCGRPSSSSPSSATSPSPSSSSRAPSSAATTPPRRPSPPRRPRGAGPSSWSGRTATGACAASRPPSGWACAASSSRRPSGPCASTSRPPSAAGAC